MEVFTPSSVIVRKCPSIFKLLPCKYQTLAGRGEYLSLSRILAFTLLIVSELSTLKGPSIFKLFPTKINLYRSRGIPPYLDFRLTLSIVSDLSTSRMMVLLQEFTKIYIPPMKAENKILAFTLSMVSKLSTSGSWSYQGVLTKIRMPPDGGQDGGLTPFECCNLQEFDHLQAAF
ncbi:hypothetical protein HAX54_038059 [Datura stramonium]|uniref:Uncharacterized protein n=1 Tax=Datura stramonium TaxID=4076 RepID=A0ABS8VN86_DATST|nr:hypothetical protein [Datura stramonium]